MLYCPQMMNVTLNKKRENEMKTITVAKGKTYEAREDLKKVGFAWNPTLKRWESANPNLDKWEADYCRPLYCGKRAFLNQTISFTKEKGK